METAGTARLTRAIPPQRAISASVSRREINAALDDTDGNGLPDAWELAMFGSGGQNPDIDHDPLVAGEQLGSLADVHLGEASSDDEANHVARIPHVPGATGTAG